MSLSLPIWYQDGLTKQWRSGNSILQGKGHACISPDRSNEINWLPLQKIRPRRALGIQNREEMTKSPGGRNSNTGHGGSKDLQKAPPSAASTLWSPLLGTNKNPYNNQAENVVSQQRMPRSPENIFVALLALLACASPPAKAELINHTYWAYIPNLALLQVVE